MHGQHTCIQDEEEEGSGRALAATKTISLDPPSLSRILQGNAPPFQSWDLPNMREDNSSSLKRENKDMVNLPQYPMFPLSLAHLSLLLFFLKCTDGRGGKRGKEEERKYYYYERERESGGRGFAPPSTQTTQTPQILLRRT